VTGLSKPLIGTFILNLHVVVLETEWLISPKASIQAKRELKAVPR